MFTTIPGRMVSCGPSNTPAGAALIPPSMPPWVRSALASEAQVGIHRTVLETLDYYNRILTCQTGSPAQSRKTIHTYFTDRITV